MDRVNWHNKTWMTNNWRKGEIIQVEVYEILNGTESKEATKFIDQLTDKLIPDLTEY